MPPTTTSSHLSPAELSYLHTSLSSHPPIRPDSRLATDFRPLNAEIGVLPNTMGSAHVGFADGREAVVGVRAEVEKTTQTHRANNTSQDMEIDDTSSTAQTPKGQAEWVTLSLSLPSMRDDDKELVFLEETLREVLVQPSLSTTSMPHKGVTSLQDALVINKRWHWHLYIDILLISPPDSSSSTSGTSTSSSSTSPLPILSMATYFALRDTRIPDLKSEGEEDPVANDDWAASIFLYTPAPPTPPSKNTNATTHKAIITPGITPPVTLLVMTVGENVIFDPSATELAVADGVWAISISRTNNDTDRDNLDNNKNNNNKKKKDRIQDIPTGNVQILGVRMLETSARDTMKGVPRDINTGAAAAAGGGLVNGKFDLGSGTDQTIPGVWKPKVGGVKRNVVVKVMKAVAGTGTGTGTNTDVGSVGKEILKSLDGFLITQ